MLRSISHLMDQPVAAFISVVALGVILIAATRMARRPRPDGPLALWACLAIALLLSYLSVLKHFQFHYLVVPSAVVAIGILSALADTRRNERLLAGSLPIAAGLACVFVTIPAFIRQNEVLQTMTRDVLDDARLIKQMSSGWDSPTVWDYRVLVQGFAAGFVVAYAGSPRITAWYDQAELRDRMFQFAGSGRWRFAVVEKWRRKRADLAQALGRNQVRRQGPGVEGDDGGREGELGFVSAVRTRPIAAAVLSAPLFDRTGGIADRHRHSPMSKTVSKYPDRPFSRVEVIT